MNNMPLDAKSNFLVTKEYRRFAELCDACRRYRYIGLCHGQAGVGKTLSARYYAHWDEISGVIYPYFRPSHLSLDTLDKRIAEKASVSLEILENHTIFYTPPIAGSPRVIESDIYSLFNNFNNLFPLLDGTGQAELIIVDEVDWLKMNSLEQLRAIYDRQGVGLVLIGMPGVEKRFARYPQLYSRVGFVHQFRPLSVEEMRFILAYKWQQVGLTLDPSDFTDAEAIAVIIHYTSGNFRLLQRLFTQIENILQVNELRTISKEVVETAAQNLAVDVSSSTS